MKNLSIIKSQKSRDNLSEISQSIHEGKPLQNKKPELMRNAHTPSRSIFELKKELHNTIGQLEDSTLPPLHHSPSVLIQPGSQLNDQSYYYSQNKFLNAQTNLMMAYAQRQKKTTQINKSNKHVWFGKKYKGGKEGGVLKYKDPYDQPAQPPLFNKPPLNSTEKSETEQKEKLNLDLIEHDDTDVKVSHESESYNLQYSKSKSSPKSVFSNPTVDIRCNYCLDKSVPLERIGKLCDHQMCKRCIQHCYLMLKIKPKYDDLYGKIKCPYCGVFCESNVKDEDLHDTINTYQSFEQQWPNPTDVISPAEPLIMCEYCSQISKVPDYAEYNCLTCKILVCSVCKSEHRVIANKNIKHEIIDFKNPRKSEENKLCQEHREPCSNFCFDCHQMCCNLCIKYGTTHNDHRVDKFKEFIREISEEQGELRVCAKTAIHTIKDKINFLNINLNFINEQKEYWDKKLFEIFSELSKIMKEKYNEIQNKIDDLFIKLGKYNNECLYAFKSL